VTVSVSTTFGTGMVDIRKPRYLCAPADKNGEGISDPSAYLMCYQVHTSFAHVPETVLTANQFGSDAFGVFGIRELCVPSIMQP
jgi:hypothetical protein